jgi:anti-anti-sigma regulatory factor
MGQKCPGSVQIWSRLCTSSEGTLVADIKAVFAPGTRVIIDLTETRFLDSSIIGALIRGEQQSHEKAEDALVVVAPPGSFTRRVFATVGFEAQCPSTTPWTRRLRASHKRPGRLSRIGYRTRCAAERADSSSR